MPHYFLNIRDGDRLIADCEGGPYINLEAAREAAVAAARERLSEHMRVGRFPIGLRIEICGADNDVLTVVPFRHALTGLSGADDEAELGARLDRLLRENIALRLEFERHKRRARTLCDALSKFTIAGKQAGLRTRAERGA